MRSIGTRFLKVTTFHHPYIHFAYILQMHCDRCTGTICYMLSIFLLIYHLNMIIAHSSLSIYILSSFLTNILFYTYLSCLNSTALTNSLIDQFCKSTFFWGVILKCRSFLMTMNNDENLNVPSREKKS